MLTFTAPAAEIIKQRHSCRTYQKKPIAAETVTLLASFARSLVSGPFSTPLRFELAAAGAHAVSLAMLRMAPSASNGQPWRVVQEGPCYHFYLRRKPGSRPGNSSFLSFTIADLPRVDMGIAMCHFQFAAQELGLEGRWEAKEPDIQKPDEMIEYIVSWIGSIS